MTLRKRCGPQYPVKEIRKFLSQPMPSHFREIGRRFDCSVNNPACRDCFFFIDECHCAAGKWPMPLAEAIVNLCLVLAKIEEREAAVNEDPPPPFSLPH